MLRRLRIYFTGFGIGLIIVVIFFMRDDTRDLDIWTPEQRILEDIRADSVLLAGPRMKCFQTCLDMSDEELLTLWTDSKTKSLNPGGDPYLYLISLTTDDHHYEAEIEWDKETRQLHYIRDLKNPQDCACQ